MRLLILTIVIFLLYSGNNTTILNSSDSDYALYRSKSKKLVHHFEVRESNNLIEKGKIYRYFKDYGTFESMHIVGDEVDVVYSSEPTGMVNADLMTNEIFVCPVRSKKVFYLFVMRSIAKALGAESKDIKYNGINLKIKKSKTFKETGRVFSTYKVTSNPKILEGEISCLDDLLVVNVDLDIYIRNARSHDFEDVFLLPEHFQFGKVRLIYSTNFDDYPAKKFYYFKKDIKNLLKNPDFEIIEAEG